MPRCTPPHNTLCVVNEVHVLLIQGINSEQLITSLYCTASSSFSLPRTKRCRTPWSRSNPNFFTSEAAELSRRHGGPHSKFQDFGDFSCLASLVATRIFNPEQKKKKKKKTKRRIFKVFLFHGNKVAFPFLFLLFLR